MGVGNGMEQYISRNWPESDLEMMQGTIPEYIDNQPFNIYYMTVSGHSVYNWEGNSMSRKNQERVEALEYSEPVKAYIAANLELEDAMTYLVDQLEAKGIADDTVIVLSADHYPYGLEEEDKTGTSRYLEELYGHEVHNNLERDENRLIIWSGCLEDMDPIVVEDPVSAIDILPTLSNLFGTEWDSRLLPGRDVFSDALPLIFDIGYDWKTDLGTYILADDKFTPVSETTEVPEGYIEQMSQIVANKMQYCTAILSNDYFGHVMGAMGPQTPVGGKQAGTGNSSHHTHAASAETDTAEATSDTGTDESAPSETDTETDGTDINTEGDTGNIAGTEEADDAA